MPRRKLPARIARFIIGEAGEAKLRLMAEISRKISIATELDELLNFIVEAAGEVINYDAAGIFLLDAATNTTRYVAGTGYSESGRIDIPLKENVGIVGSVISTGESVIAAQVEEDPHYLNLRKETHSQLTVPIASDGEVIVTVSYNAPVFVPLLGALLSTPGHSYRTVTATARVRVAPCNETKGT